MKLFQTNNIDGSNNHLKVIVMLLVLVMVFNGVSDSCGGSDGNDIRDGGGGVILWV